MADDIFNGKVDLSSLLKNTKHPQIDYASVHLNRIEKENERVRNILKEQQLEKIEKEIREEQRAIRQIELLEEIRDNTGSLVNMVDFIRVNTNQQTEIMLIIADILKIGTATTPEEADSLYKQVVGKINSTVENVESMSTLIQWATNGWEHIKNLF